MIVYRGPSNVFVVLTLLLLGGTVLTALSDFDKRIVLWPWPWRAQYHEWEVAKIHGCLVVENLTDVKFERRQAAALWTIRMRRQVIESATIPEPDRQIEIGRLDSEEASIRSAVPSILPPRTQYPLPLFVPAIALLLIPSSWVRHRFSEVRVRRLNLCQSCRYCLTGNLSGVCPECGTCVPTEAWDLEAQTS